MPTSVRDRQETEELFAVDTSVAIAFLDASHTAHEKCLAVLRGRPAALAGHAAFESFSVLTRMPGITQASASDAIEALSAAFPEPCWLNAKQQGSLLKRLGDSGVTSGMVYDALVGEAARLNERLLLTRDRRAIATYEFLGVEYRLVD